MSAETDPSIANRSKLPTKKSFRLRIRSNKPKLEKTQSLFSSHRKRHRSKSSSISCTKNANHRRQSSRFMDFIHGTLDKLSLSPASRSMSSLAIGFDIDSLDTPKSRCSVSSPAPKSRWKPSLDTIYRDAQLLSALIAFMERSYSDESIRFLQSVRHLDAQMEDEKTEPTEIDNCIRSIFQSYIANSAESQINLSSDCFTNTARMCQPNSLSSYSLNTKRKIFDPAVAEIERLMIRSVLSLFYQSDEFQRIAVIKTPTLPPSSPTSMPLPIILSMSQCTLSHDDSAMVGTVIGPPGIPEKGEFEEYAAVAFSRSTPSPLLTSVTCASCPPTFDILGPIRAIDE